MSKITEKIKDWLFDNSHTKKDLAKELEISSRTLENRLVYENWSFDEACKLAELFGCQLQDFQ